MVTLRWSILYDLFHPSLYYFWLWFLAGITGAILSFRFWDLGVTFSGAFGGFAVAMGIIAVSNHGLSNVWRYILLALLIVIGACIATIFERFSMIVGTSFGGGFLFMYGVDELVQVGFREMLVIFEFAGKTLKYRPEKKVFVMLGCWLILALVGIGWEFWHHSKPIWINDKALFRIYGRPFGKRPKQLVGQRITQRVSRMDWYLYWANCLCLRRKTAEEVLYEDYFVDEQDEVVEEDFVVLGAHQHQREKQKQQQQHLDPTVGITSTAGSSLPQVPIKANNTGGGGCSSIEKHSDSDTVIYNESGISLRTTLNHQFEIKVEDIKEDHHQVFNDDNTSSGTVQSIQQQPSDTPVRIVIEETDYKDDGTGPVVTLGTHTEPIVETTCTSSTTRDGSRTLTTTTTTSRTTTTTSTSTSSSEGSSRTVSA